MATQPHTPGRWVVEHTGDSHIWIHNDAPRTIFDSRSPDVWPIKTADSRLIEAAPDLLAALEALTATADAVMGALDWPEYRQARAAIAKAREA